MESEGSLPLLQVPATCPCPDPDRSTPCSQIPLPEDIILPSMPGSSKQSLSFRFPHQTPVYTSPLPIRITCSSHLIPLDLIARTILGEKYSSRNSPLCSFIYSPLTSSLLGPNIPLSTLFSNTLRLHSSFNVATKIHTPI